MLNNPTIKECLDALTPERIKEIQEHIERDMNKSNSNYLDTDDDDSNPYSVPIDDESHLYQDCIFIDGEAYDLNELPF